jgi:hypothetical protein
MNKMDIKAVKEKHEKKLMQLPNVAGVGIGKKSGRQVIKVFVTRKLPESELKPQEVVPKTLEGCETDVEEVGIITTQTQ